VFKNTPVKENFFIINNEHAQRIVLCFLLYGFDILFVFQFLFIDYGLVITSVPLCIHTSVPLHFSHGTTYAYYIPMARTS